MPVTTHRTLGVTAGLLAAGLLLVACGDDGGNGGAAGTTLEDAGPTSTTVAAVIDPGDGGDYAPELDPAGFTAEIDNPYLPLAPGSRWVYDGISDGEDEHIEVEVLDETRVVMGITAVVVRDTVTVGGEVVEDTLDWYAQDADGNVWYLGEATEEYEGGEVVSTAGSWEAGVDGALPGIVMPADPTVGHAYRQEYLAGEAEDMGEVIRVGETVSVAAGDYTDVVVTRDWTPLEPDVVEEKSYAPGVGFVFETKTSDGGGETAVELTEFSPGG